MLPAADSFEAMRARFAWEIPERYNMGVDVSDRWAAIAPERPALIAVDEAGAARDVSFGALAEQSARLANVLLAHGLRGARPGAGPREAGDRLGVLLPQRPETAVAHIAAWKAGLVSLPLFTLFGPDALAHRLRDSGARAVIADAAGAARLAGLRAELPALRVVFCVDGPAPGAEDYAAALAAADPGFEPVESLAEDPALLIYTSGTTGQPKGALHAQRVLLGHLPGMEASHEFFPQPGDRIWTPADWAWIGGLLNILMPALHHGVPVVARRFAKFDAEAAFALLRDQGVRNSFLPPTALKMMRGAVAEPERFGLRMRTVASGGEPLGTELLDWGRRAFGVTINEFYGQTECNLVVSTCATLAPAPPGAMGRAAPGHEVAVLDAESGARVAAGVEGAIAVAAPDPAMLLEYWEKPEATRDKFLTDAAGRRWLLTGDRGSEDGDGWFRFIGRDDDVIGSAGYRIGPGEIEDCLLRHPAVRLAGVVGKPDPMRGAVVAAYVLLDEGYAPDAALAEDIAGFVKARLAAHEYPRAVRFLAEMPMTTTGKILRRELRRLAEAEAAAEADAASAATPHDRGDPR